MLKRALILLSINLVVFCSCAEVLALGVFYYQHRWLFYAYPYRQTYPVIPEGQAQQFTDVGLHPYFGPVHGQGIPLDIPPELRDTPASPARVATNNLGFASPHDYPFAKTRDDQFIVGIFGGSVAAWFCQAGVARLTADLKQQPFFKDKDLVPLCFSHEGYKQPQQLIVLAYFLSIGQQFDLVINIDGFNEVTLSRLNAGHGWDVSMPSVMHLDPLINLVNQSTLTPDKLDSLAAIRRDRQRLSSLAVRLNRNRLAWLIVIKGLEWFVRNTPDHMHVLPLFIKPEELKAYCRKSGMLPVEMTGIRPALGPAFWKMLATRRVPRDFKFRLTPDLKISYLGYAKKT